MMNEKAMMFVRRFSTHVRRLLSLALVLSLLGGIRPALAQDEAEAADATPVDLLAGEPLDVPSFVPPPRSDELLPDQPFANQIEAESPLVAAARVPTASIEVTYNGFSPEAQGAFEYAVQIWETLVSSPVPIKVNATWAPLAPGILGSAGPTQVWRGFANAPRSDTWYPVALTNKLRGSDINPGLHDINATFSSVFSNWYFGTDGNVPLGRYDFVTLVMHELGHGLGFIGSASVTSGIGTYGSGSPTRFPYVYDRFAVTGTGQQIVDTTLFPNPSMPLAVVLRSNNLFLNAPNAIEAAGGVQPRLYAPATWNGGASFTHLNEATYSTGNPNSLMTPFISTAEGIHTPGPITTGLFRDMGWTTPPPDPTPPFVTPVVDPATPDGANSWYRRDVAIAWTIVEDDSPIITTSGCDPFTVAADQSVRSYTCRVTSSGGLRTSTVSIRRDATSPLITAALSPAGPATTGWYNLATGAPVVRFTCSDATSGIAFNACPAAYTFPEGADQIRAGIVRDRAGNEGSTVVSVNVDLTPPLLSCPDPMPRFVLHDPAAAVVAKVDDAVSGPALSSVSRVASASAVGVYEASLTASDLAGNRASVTCSYQVVYAFAGFDQPVDNDVLNRAKTGRAIPLKWQLTDFHGMPVTEPVDARVTVATLDCVLGATADQVEEYAPGESGLRHLGDGRYHFNWQTPTDYAGSCKTIQIDLNEGAELVHTAAFAFVP